MRDEFKPRENFELLLSIADQVNGGPNGFDEWAEKYEKNKGIDNHSQGYLNVQRITGSSLRLIIDYILIKYCIGESIEEIRDDHLQDLINQYEYVHEALADEPLKDSLFGDNGSFRRPHDDHSIYSFLGLVLCLGVSETDLKKITPLLGRAGEDRLMDSVIGMSHPGRKIGQGCGNPQAFWLLNRIIDASASERPVLVKKYLDNWHKYIRFISGGGSLGLTVYMNYRMKTRADLVASISEDHRGFFAWEVALVVKFFHIDDSLFKDHEFYPADMVDFQPPLNNAGYLEWLQGEISQHPNHSDNLTVAIDRDPNLALAKSELSNIDTSDNYLYRAFLNVNSKGSNKTTSEPSPVSYPVSYSVVCYNDKEMRVGFEELGKYSISQMNRMRPEVAVLSANELVDLDGGKVRYDFVEEAFEYIWGDEKDGAMLYASRMVEKGRDSATIVAQYIKTVKKLTLVIRATIKGDQFCYEDVKPHWLWLIQQYEELI